MRFDLRYEFIDLDQPRAGRDRIAVGAIPHHHDEVETRNQNWSRRSTGISPRRGALAHAAVRGSRAHSTSTTIAAKAARAWDFRGLGDAARSCATSSCR
jgi:hypothetical protein